MTPERWARIKALFHASLDMTVEERETYLSAQCEADGDVGLRAEVDRLLSAHSNAGRFIEHSPVAAGSAVEVRADGVMTGRVIGRYQIGRRIGVGGMGQVYAARDLELGREVALKVAIDSDHESHARLRREAQHASRLNHSRICTIHEIGSVDGKPFIAMELIEGPTLADRIAGGALALDEALGIARQMIEALDEAHAHGVIHRDFKPANVKVRPDGTVKVLDFGLAKTSATAIAPYADATSPVTRAGMIVGTPAYMAPEQVQGKPIDKRVDIWAFGCVLYELVTGEPPFRGETISDVLAAVLTTDPLWDRVPPSLQGLLRRCLQRDPASRLRDIGDAMALVDHTPPTSSLPAATRRRREWWAWSAAALLLITTLGALAINLRSTSPAALPQVHLEILLPDGYTVVPFSVVPSSDGRSVAYLAAAAGSGQTALWIYTVASGVSRAVVALDRAGPVNPFWSPDGHSIGVFNAGKIRRVDVTTGAMETVCDAPGAIGRGSWNKEDVIIFGIRAGEGNNGLMRVTASGGTPVLLTRTDRAHQQVGHGNPAFLPDGRFFVYQAIVGGEPQDLYVGSLDASPEAQDSTPLLTFPGVVRYTPSPDPRRGYLLFMRDGKLMAQPFDNQQRRLDGHVVIVPGQSSQQLTSREFAGAADILTYRHVARPNGSLVWVDRHGRETPALGGAELEAPEYPRFSPDGGRLALALNGDIWVYDLSGRPPIKLTFDGTSFAPLWTRDGRRLIFESPSSLMSIAADGSDRVAQRASRDGHYHAHGWTRDGELVGLGFSGGLGRIITLPATTSGEPRPIVNMRTGGEEAPALSPDGLWLAYAALATGRSEIWVQPFPSGPPTRVSGRGGIEPIWSRSGQELFYLEDQKLISVAVKTGEQFLAGQPVALFEGPYLRLGQPPSYDVSPDGRFLMIKPTRQERVPITAIFNWTAAMRPVAPNK